MFTCSGPCYESNGASSCVNLSVPLSYHFVLFFLFLLVFLVPFLLSCHAIFYFISFYFTVLYCSFPFFHVSNITPVPKQRYICPVPLHCSAIHVFGLPLWAPRALDFLHPGTLPANLQYYVQPAMRSEARCCIQSVRTHPLHKAAACLPETFRSRQSYSKGAGHIVIYRRRRSGYYASGLAERQRRKANAVVPVT